MAAANNNHSHRSGKLKQTNKRNKRTNASKRSITRNSGGKVNSLSLGGGAKRGGARGSLKGGRDHISKAKANRINSAKQRRQISKKNIWSNRRFGTSHAGGATISAGSTTSPKLSGLEGTLNRAISNVPPRIIGIISLSENEVQLENLVRCTLLNGADKVLTSSNSPLNNNSLSNSSNSASITAAYNTHSKGGQPHLTILTNSSSFNSQYDSYEEDDKAIQSALDLCRVCDLVMFVIDGSSVVATSLHGGGSTVGGSTVGGMGDAHSIGGGGMSVKTNNTTAHLDHIISDRGDRILVAIRGQGLPTPVTVIVHKENSNTDSGSGMIEGMLSGEMIGGLPKDIGSGAGGVQEMQDDDDSEDEEEMEDCVTSLQGPTSTSIGGRSIKSIRRSTIRKRSELKRYVSRLAATEFGEGISKIVELDIPSSGVCGSSGVGEKMEEDSAIATSTALSATKNKSQTSVAALVRMLCTISASGPNWVTDSMRPFLLTDGTIGDSSSTSNTTSKVNVAPVKYDETTQELSLTGYIRGNTVWNTNQLVHVPHLGTFAVKDVKLAGVNVGSSGEGNDLLPPIVAAGRKVRKVKSSAADKDMKDVSAADDNKEGMILAKPNLEERESLEMFASPDALEGEQNLIGFDDIEEEGDDEFDLNNNNEGEGKKSSVQFQPGTARPAGWSDYQSAWLDALDPNEDEDADDRGELAFALNKKTNDADTLMGGDDDDDDGINAEEKRILLAQRKKDAKSDLQFPDEVDYEEETSARDRYARYRALKSFRKSYWDPKENLPESYGAVYHFSSFKSTQRDVLEDVKEVEDVVKRRGWGVTVGGGGAGGDDEATMDDEERDSDDEEEEDMARSCVIPGAYVTITLENVPPSAYANLSPSTLLVAVSLLPHENKVSVLHMGLTHSSKSEHDTEIPIKSKDVLTFRCGWRTWQSRPVFSQHNLNSDKHKFERYMPEGGGGTYFAASVFGPVTYAPCPVLMFREANEGSKTGDIGSGSIKKREFLAHGSMLGADADRIVLKRIILTGYPTRVHKRHATVKYMFYNPEDVKVRRRLEVPCVVFQAMSNYIYFFSGSCPQVLQQSMDFRVISSKVWVIMVL